MLKTVEAMIKAKNPEINLKKPIITSKKKPIAKSPDKS